VTDKKKVKLTKKQEDFCREFIIDFHITHAAIRAGYSEKTAASIGSENLTKPEIVDRVAELAEEVCEKASISAEEVLAGIKAIATSKESKDGDKLRAWELLGKYLQLFIEKKQIDLTTKGESLNDGPSDADRKQAREAIKERLTEDDG
jgi:hypothetical protein